MGQLRNGLVVSSAQAVIAVAGEWGTLSEIGLALKLGIPLVGWNTWELSREGRPYDGITRADTPADAVERAFALCGKG
jgi:predicted Rossmann-fold nucleotide-binding protein